ncbi:MAG TPA: cysteine--tRNA ligase [Microbacteriaceae bacterium]|nr:cysteine--tRNA ligase [Microbacteriaceae bacterium]
MTIRLYDTRDAELRDFVPLVPGAVSMYVCGPTVQSSPHVGHLRSALNYDILRRWFSYRGFAVTFVRNVTDIDDKILANASEHESWWALAYRIELEFAAAYRSLGILDPGYEPRATASIGQMVELIASLIERGHAYVATDASGDVYFDTATWPSYGELTRQSREAMEAAEDADPRGKRDPRDFALWKGQKPNEPASASWPAPWGAGRPGWHIECSAMAVRYLGESFDIHGGGLDLRFPHHENELAQSRAAGHGFARYWVHNGLVTVGGQKMSKSLGNSVFASELLSEASPMAVRYLLGSAHYRSTLDLGPNALAEARAALERVTGFVTRAQRTLAGRPQIADELPLVPEGFAAAMDDDLNVPQALAVLHETVGFGNLALESRDLEALAARAGEVRAMVAVLVLDSVPEARDSNQALDAVMQLVIERRAAARALNDWTTADRIRDTLTAAGISLEDGPDGTHWSMQ